MPVRKYAREDHFFGFPNERHRHGDGQQDHENEEPVARHLEKFQNFDQPVWQFIDLLEDRVERHEREDSAE